MECNKLRAALALETPIIEASPPFRLRRVQSDPSTFCVLASRNKIPVSSVCDKCAVLGGPRALDNRLRRLGEDIVQPSYSSQAHMTPRWTSLSAEDRRRFGLDSTCSNLGANRVRPPSCMYFSGEDYVPRSSKAVLMEADAIMAPANSQKHPDVRWAGFDRRVSAVTPLNPTPMVRTLVELESLGAKQCPRQQLASLWESERRLQALEQERWIRTP